MNDSLGKVTREPDGFQVRFERIYNHPIGEVWDAITNPEKLKYWFTDFEFEPEPGSKMIIRFRDSEGSESYGEVVAFDPPHRFVWSWETELISWHLTELEGGRCRLILVHSRMEEQYAISAPAGFHDLLDRLEAALDGDTTTYAFGTEVNDPDHLVMVERYGAVLIPEFPELERYQPIVVERSFKASVERVWQAITDKDQMRQWYFELSDFKPEVGFEFSFPGQGHKGAEYIHLCKILEVIPRQKLTYSWAYKGHEGHSTVTFELSEENGGTRLRLIHRGLGSFPADNPDFARSSFNGGWNELIGNLLGKFLGE